MLYRITDAVAAVAKGLGITRVKLAYMLNHSVPYGQRKTTRRYNDYVFRIDRGELCGIVYSPTPEQRTATLVCPDCDNDGGFCLTCDSTGHVKSVIMVDPSTGRRIMEDNGNAGNYGSISSHRSGNRRPVR